jgi:hypothetical protein
LWSLQGHPENLQVALSSLFNERFVSIGCCRDGQVKCRPTKISCAAAGSASNQPAGSDESPYQVLQCSSANKVKASIFYLRLDPNHIAIDFSTENDLNVEQWAHTFAQ